MWPVWMRQSVSQQRHLERDITTHIWTSDRGRLRKEGNGDLGEQLWRY
jgi:hypothetical protein